jgi:glutamyl-tRNA synthetase
MLISRLAPSPTGSLHLGNVRTFLWAWLSARAQGGKVILRVEDLETRGKAGVVEKMLDDLHWLGLTWEEGPAPHQPGPETGELGPYVQSHRRAFYQTVHQALRDGGMIYPCICTRADIAASQSAPHEGDKEMRYPGTCRDRKLSQDEIDARTRSGKPPAWRLRLDPGTVEFDDLLFGKQSLDVEREVGDFVIAKAPDNPAYQLAVVADDIAMGVTEVVRGDDLIPSTARQILLYRAISKVLPEAPPGLKVWQTDLPRYGHVPLVVGPDGKRTAKRHGDARIADFRAKGLRPERIIATLGRWSGLDAPPEAAPRELVSLWSWQRVSKERVMLTDERLAELK